MNDFLSGMRQYVLKQKIKDSFPPYDDNRKLLYYRDMKLALIDVPFHPVNIVTMAANYHVQFLEFRNSRMAASGTFNRYTSEINEDIDLVEVVRIDEEHLELRIYSPRLYGELLAPLDPEQDTALRFLRQSVGNNRPALTMLDKIEYNLRSESNMNSCY